MSWQKRIEGKTESLRNLTKELIAKVAENFFTKEEIEKHDIVNDINDNRSGLSVKDHIVFETMRKGLGIENTYYASKEGVGGYSHEFFYKGFAESISSVHEVVGKERPPLNEIISQTKIIVDNMIDTFIGNSKTAGK